MVCGLDKISKKKSGHSEKKKSVRCCHTHVGSRNLQKKAIKTKNIVGLIHDRKSKRSRMHEYIGSKAYVCLAVGATVITQIFEFIKNIDYCTIP